MTDTQLPALDLDALERLIAEHKKNAEAGGACSIPRWLFNQLDALITAARERDALLKDFAELKTSWASACAQIADLENELATFRGTADRGGEGGCCS